MRQIKGNILDTELKHIIHGCNAVGVMGAGVALAIKRAYPKAFKDYLEGINFFHGQATTYHDELLGKVIRSVCDDGRFIHNAITQATIGSSGIHARYYAIIDALRNIINENKNVVQFATVKIGCGLGGLEWSVVSVLMQELEAEYGVEFWVYDL